MVFRRVLYKIEIAKITITIHKWNITRKLATAKNAIKNDRQTDRLLYFVIKLRVVPSGAKSNLLSTGALSTNIHYLHGKYYIKGTTTSI